VIAQRRSVRAFQDRPVESDKLHRILGILDHVPSAGGLQSYRVYTVKNREVRQALVQASFGKQQFIAQAPVALVFCALPQRSAARYRERGERLYALQDATIACAHIQLAAVALGLASTWVGAFDDRAVSMALGLSEAEVPVAILPIGYPAEMPAPVPHRPLSDMVREV